MSKHLITEPTDKRVFRILKSAQVISALTTAIETETMDTLTDSKFKSNRTLNNHIRNLKQSIAGIDQEVAQFARVKSREDFTYEFGIEFHRLVSFFAFLPTEQIRDFMDGAERMTQVAREEEVNK